jgi:hypothetical protein
MELFEKNEEVNEDEDEEEEEIIKYVTKKQEPEPEPEPEPEEEEEEIIKYVTKKQEPEPEQEEEEEEEEEIKIVTKKQEPELDDINKRINELRVLDKNQLIVIIYKIMKKKKIDRTMGDITRKGLGRVKKEILIREILKFEGYNLDEGELLLEPKLSSLDKRILELRVLDKLQLLKIIYKIMDEKKVNRTMGKKKIDSFGRERRYDTVTRKGLKQVKKEKIMKEILKFEGYNLDDTELSLEPERGYKDLKLLEDHMEYLEYMVKEYPDETEHQDSLNNFRKELEDYKNRAKNVKKFGGSKLSSKLSQGFAKVAEKINPFGVALKNKKTANLLTSSGDITHDYILPAVVEAGKPIGEAVFMSGSTALTGNPLLGRAVYNSLWKNMVADKGYDPRQYQKSKTLGKVAKATGAIGEAYTAKNL